MAAISLLQLGLLTSGLRAFVLPGSGSEAEQPTGLQEDIAAIFLGEALGARLGAGAGYSGAVEAGLAAEAEVVQQILRGTAALTNTADSGPSLGSSSLTQATVEADTRHENCADYTEGDWLIMNYIHRSFISRLNFESRVGLLLRPLLPVLQRQHRHGRRRPHRHQERVRGAQPRGEQVPRLPGRVLQGELSLADADTVLISDWSRTRPSCRPPPPP